MPWFLYAGDIYVVEQLMDLKRRYPDRVHFILGNRDTNKLRLIQELSESHMTKYPFKSYPGTFWSSQFFEKSPQETLKDLGIQTPPSPNDRVERLKWILSCTMGSGDAFELRRLELQGDGDNREISDDEVFQNFVHNINEGGVFAQFLQEGCLALVMGDTLFVHGALDETSLGFNPDRPEDPERNTRKWVDELNAFAKREILQCIQEGAREAGASGEAWSHTGGYGDVGVCGKILQYGMGWLPSGERNPTFIYRDWRGDRDRVASLPSSHVVRTLQEQGINRILTGHKPDGDAPLVMANRENDFHVIVADTSYSGTTIWLDKDKVGGEQNTCTQIGADPSIVKGIDSYRRHMQRRGGAVCEVVVEMDSSQKSKGQ
jgi:hypothetical protein